jgi:hypothetical protein
MTSSNTSILDEIAALEDARCTAMLKGDVATLERLLHPVLVYMHSTGVADSKPATYLGYAMEFGTISISNALTRRPLCRATLRSFSIDS